MLDHKNNRQLRKLPAGLADELENCIAPAEAALCIPPKCYTSEDHYAHEIDLIFRRKWIGIGHAGRFKVAGDYEAMEIGGVPIIVLRDKQGALRAYANSCRHRGARLLEGEGRCAGIRCPFHSWAYKLDGMLAGVPEIEEMPDFDRSQYGLIEFRAAEIAGLGFVCLDNDTPSAKTQLGDLLNSMPPGQWIRWCR